jgi:D-amino-acid dehydrogenase
MNITIIGGGVIGLCCAHYLQKDGHSVTVIESNDITSGCSFGNMGYVSPSHFTPLATPGIIAQGLRWMLSPSSPFYIKPRLNMELIRWGLRFWKKSNAGQMAASIPHLNNLLQLSRGLMTDIKNELPTAFDFTDKGIWMLYKQAKTGEHEKHLAEQAHGFGLKTVVCNAAEVQRYETEVEVDVAGGVLYLDDAHLNPARFMQALYARLQQAGVRFKLGSTVTGFEKKNGGIAQVFTNQGSVACDEVIVANGSWMGQTAKLLGISLLMQPGKGYSIVYEGLEKNLQYPSILVDDRTATTPIGPWLRIGGTMELSGHSNNVLPKRVQAIYQAFKKYYPAMDIAVPDPAKAWYGYRPVSPDGMPYIGRHKAYNNLSFAGGHAMLGVSAAAGTGQLISEIIGNQKPSIALEAFDPQR